MLAQACGCTCRNGVRPDGLHGTRPPQDARCPVRAASPLSPVPRFIRFGSDGNAMPRVFHPQWIQVSLETGQFCPFKHYRRGCLGWSAAMIGTEMEVNSVGRYGDAPSVLVASDHISGGRPRSEENTSDLQSLM